MALDRGFTGFESGERDSLISLVAAVFTGHRPRTGDFCVNVAATSATNTGHASLPIATLGNTLAVGENVRGRLRFFMRLERYPSVSHVAHGGFGRTGQSVHLGQIVLDTTGHFAAQVQGSVRSTYSTAVLALGTWYEIDLELFGQNVTGGSDPLDCTVTVRDEGGTLIETKTISGFMNTAQALGEPTVMGENSILSTKGADYDDLVFIAGDKADVNVTLPTAKRISPMYITGQGASAGWTGDWRNCRDTPRDTTITTEQTTSTDEASTTFTKRTAAALGVSGIEATKITTAARASGGAGNDAILWNGAEFTVALSTTYSTTLGQLAYDWTALSVSAWDSAELGFRNKRGVATELGKILGEVLHSGTPIPDSEVAGTASLKIKCGIYTGNGTFLTVTGVGFRAQFLLIKKTSGSSSAGLMWNRRLGGTNAKRLLGGTVLNQAAVMGIQADGFELGPDTNVNQSGVVYAYVAIQDGGGDGFGRYFEYGSYIGDALDDRNIVAATGFQAELALVFNGAAVQYRNSSFVGDPSLQVGTQTGTANLLQALNANGFQVGSSLNGASQIYPWVAFRKGIKAHIIMDYGSFTASGGTFTVTGLSFSPMFALGDRPAVADGAWRSSDHHTGANSTNWENVTTITDGFTALNADGFTVGARLSVASETTSWAAFKTGEVDITEVEFENADVSIGLTWVELIDSLNTLHVWSKVALPDPASYFGGYKEDRVIRWGQIRRALSDRNGQYEGTDFGWVLSDTDRFIRGLLGADSTRFFVNRPVTVRMIDDASRRQLLTPRTVVKGIVREYRPLSPLHFEFTVQDILAAKFSPSNTKDQIPQRVVTTTDFPNCPPDNVGVAVPIIYGEASDKNEVTETVPTTPVDVPPGWPRRALQKPTNLTGTPFGSHSASVTRQYAITTQNVVYSGGFPNPPWAAPGWGAGDHRGETDASYITIAGCPTDQEIIDGGGAVGVEVRWNHPGGSTPWANQNPRPFPYSDFYRVYGRTPGLLKFLDFADVGFGEISPVYYDGRRPYGGAEFDILKMDGDPPSTNNTIVDGTGEGGTTVTTDHGTGIVPVIYVGTRDIAGSPWHEFLICGHAIKAVLGWYVDGVRESNTTEGTGNDAFLMPGFAGFTSLIGAQKFRDYNGRRYGVCYARGSLAEQLAQGEKTLTLNIQGIEATGDGNGTLITDIHQQYKHAVINWILQSYQSGAWLTAPVFPDDVTLPQIDEASFDNATSTAATRIAGGYKGAFIIGANNERTTVRDLVARLNVSADVDSGFNRKTQFMVSMASEAISEIATAVPLADVLDIFSGSFDIEDRVFELYNRVPYFYRRDYTGKTDGKAWETEAAVVDGVSVTGVGEEKSSPDVELFMVRDQATADDVAQRRLSRTKEPPRHVKLKTGMGGLNLELGDVVTVTHFEGIGGAGWIDRPIRILRHEVDPETYEVFIEGFDMQRLFEGAFILGDEATLPASWTSATTAQKRYGYLADETTGNFSDGAHGKRLR